jgi:serine/threonine protein kinase
MLLKLKPFPRTLNTRQKHTSSRPVRVWNSSLMKNKPDTIDENEARVITDLIRRILRYDPAERPSAADLLAEEWFQDA